MAPDSSNQASGALAGCRAPSCPFAGSTWGSRTTGAAAIRAGPARGSCTTRAAAICAGSACGSRAA